MVITNKGDNYFYIQSGETLVIVDPQNQRGYKGTLVVLNTLKPALAEPPAEDAPFYIDHEGEYEVQGVRVRGYYTATATIFDEKRTHTAYLLELDDITVGILGHYGGDLSEDAEEGLGGCDIFILPAGDPSLIAASDAAKLIRQIEPGIVIPSFSKNLSSFAKEMGVDVSPEEKLVIKKKEISPKAMRVVFLKS